MNTAPIYYHSATYAREHDELDKYRATSKACQTCCRDVETIISARFDGMHLAPESISEALAIHGPELLGLVLSSTVIYREWDGRISQSNKVWAHTVRQLDRDAGSFLPTVVNTHPAILNGFVIMYRNATT
jgi:hypothetical protein